MQSAGARHRQSGTICTVVKSDVTCCDRDAACPSLTRRYPPGLPVLYASPPPSNPPTTHIPQLLTSSNPDFPSTELTHRTPPPPHPSCRLNRGHSGYYCLAVYLYSLPAGPLPIYPPTFPASITASIPIASGGVSEGPTPAVS